MRAAAVALLAVLAAGCTTLADRTGQEREANRLALADAAGRMPADAVVVVSAGQVEGRPEPLADALRAGRAVEHRFVFRPGEEGDVGYRMAFLPGGGLVAGRRFAEALGIQVIPGAAGALTLELRGLSVRFPRGTAPILELEVTPAGGGDPQPVPVHFDPDFDGPLVVDTATAAALRLPRCEIPGEAAVTVALGRPFRARRARVHVLVPELAVEGVVEILGVIEPQR